jgi:hypothetical protein
MATNKVKVELTVQVPAGTSKTKVETTLRTLLKGAVPEGFKIGAPKVVVAAPAPTADAPSADAPSASLASV